MLVAVLALAAAPLDAFARGSGGYSRPGGSSRTPSFGGGGGFRAPSFGGSSGGYSRPSAPSYNRPSYSAPPSAGDRSFSQDRSGSAFDSFRSQQNRQRQQQYPSSRQPTPQYTQRPSTQPGYGNDRPSWFNNRGWSAPPSYYGGNRSFGVWDGLFLWSLLSNLGRSGSSDWFHNNQNDPGYRQWRQEADRQAQDNADLRQKLDDLDRKLAERSDEPRTPGTLPADVPPEIAKAPPTRTPETEGKGSWVWVVLLGGAGGIAYLAWQRRPKTAGTTMSQPTSAIGTAANLLRHKLSGETYKPSMFRVGMTLALDPTPFILAGPGLKLQQPEGTGSGQVSVSAVGQVVSGKTQLVRLYLPDKRSLVQLHLDSTGAPDECRLFGTIDEITPADPGEWGAWLDASEGMIGWPEFQTKDGKTYARVWAPGGSRVSPRMLTETIEDLSGTRTVQSQAMLYAAATGAPDPGPGTEYIMVAALQDAGRAWVEVRAGIDLNPATLQLA